MSDKTQQLDPCKSHEALERASREFFHTLCHAIGEEPTREGLIRTPERLSTSLTQMLAGYAKDPKAALGACFSESECDEMIVLKDLPFYSMCEHHLLPFFGSISLGYIPNQQLVGISSLARFVEVFTQRLQIQERLTAQIAQTLMDELKPKGVMVVIRARHLCFEMRQGTSSEIITSALKGIFKNDSKTRAEFMRLVNG